MIPRPRTHISTLTMAHDFIVQFREAPFISGKSTLLVEFHVLWNSRKFSQTIWTNSLCWDWGWHCYFETQNATTILIRVGHVVSIAEGQWRHVNHVREMLFSSSRYVNFIAMWESTPCRSLQIKWERNCPQNLISMFILRWYGSVLYMPCSGFSRSWNGMQLQELPKSVENNSWNSMSPLSLIT